MYFLFPVLFSCNGAFDWLKGIRRGISASAVRRFSVVDCESNMFRETKPINRIKTEILMWISALIKSCTKLFDCQQKRSFKGAARFSV